MISAVIVVLAALLPSPWALAASAIPASGEARLTADAAQDLLSRMQGKWSPLSRTAVSITGDVKLKNNVLIFNGNTRYAIEPTPHSGRAEGPGATLEVEGVPFFRLRLLGQSPKASGRRSGLYLRDGNPLCGDNDSYLYAQLETSELGGVENAVLSVRIFEPPKKGAHGRPHYCAAYNYLKEVDKPS